MVTTLTPLSTSNSSHHILPSAPRILLTTINARYAHCALGLRYLYANMGDLQPNTEIVEFTLNHTIETIVEGLLSRSPTLIGLGVYIWNIKESTELVREIKRRAPEVILVVGGPEVSYESDSSPLFNSVDYLITGEADHAFASLCSRLLSERGEKASLSVSSSLDSPSSSKPQIISAGEVTPLSEVILPYDDYSEEDIAHRVIYVESTRGCPFRCEFCISSLSQGVRIFPTDRFFDALTRLIDRGARRFKFIDRTFNIKDEHAVAILDLFLERWHADMQLHFEIVPDRISPALLERFIAFPPAALHLEAGIQSFNPDVLALISRTQNRELTLHHLSRLINEGGAEVHVDLIVGLPSQTWSDVASDFKTLFEINPHEIQVGILKRLRGTPILRHVEHYQLQFEHEAPYEIVSTSTLSEEQITALKRFAKFAETLYNHNRFPDIISLIRRSGSDPFELLFDFSMKAWSYFGRTHSIPMTELMEAVYTALCTAHPDPWPTQLREAIEADFYRVPGRREVLNFIEPD